MLRSTISQIPTYSLETAGRFPPTGKLGLTMTFEIPDLDPVEGAGGRLHSFVDVKMSRPVWIQYKDMRDHAFTTLATATIVKAKRMPRSKTRRYYDGRRRTFSDHWRLEVRPNDDATSFTIKANELLCGERGGMCTSDGGSPSNYPETGTLTPAGADLTVSIADSTASEDDGVIVFTVSLSRAAEGTVEVDFETTTEGTATEGVDFRSGKSLLVLFPEETTYDISVELFDDAVDDDGETVIVKLTGARLVQFDPVRRKEKRRKITIADDEATGTINNSDPVPRGWLARFGRTVAGHVTDAIEARLSGPAGGGSQATLGGQLLSLDGAAPGTPDEAGPETADGLTAFADRLAAHADGGAWQRREPAASRALTGRELLLGSSFHLALGGDNADSAGTSWAAWGRAARSRFDGDAEGLALDGDVTTFTLGADAMWSRWLAGVALANSTGEGGYLDHAARGRPPGPRLGHAGEHADQRAPPMRASRRARVCPCGARSATAPAI